MSATHFAVLDADGTTIATRTATPVRPVTHALVVKAETTTRVRRRHEVRMAKDKALATALDKALRATLSLRRTGSPAQRLITVQLPAELREVLKPPVGSADSPSALIEEHRQVVQEAVDATYQRIAESAAILRQLDEEVYELAPVEVLTWVSSKQRGQRALRAASLSEPWELLGLQLVEAIQKSAA